MNKFAELLEQISEAKGRLAKLQDKLNNTPDGYVYLTKLCRYDHTTWETHVNLHSVTDLTAKYDGQYGTVEVYTNNWEIYDQMEALHKYCGFPSIHRMTAEEIASVKQQDILDTVANRVLHKPAGSLNYESYYLMPKTGICPRIRDARRMIEAIRNEQHLRMQL